MKKLLLLLLSGSLIAQSEAVFRSVAIPGWGQFYNSQSIKGLAIISAEVITITGYLYFSRYQTKTYNEYSLSTDPFEAHELFDKVQTNANLKKISISLVSAVWIYSVVDAYLNYDYSKHNLLSSNNFDVRFENDSVKLFYTFNINNFKCCQE